ncbi:hypothetical protein lerEdw1_007912 [Lerista edwardsae]|nr:hypothetical protein lerEdw1_007912 [Lerista edwardsae]
MGAVGWGRAVLVLVSEREQVDDRSTEQSSLGRPETGKVENHKPELVVSPGLEDDQSLNGISWIMYHPGKCELPASFTWVE